MSKARELLTGIQEAKEGSFKVSIEVAWKVVSSRRGPTVQMMRTFKMPYKDLVKKFGPPKSNKEKGERWIIAFSTGNDCTIYDVNNDDSTGNTDWVINGTEQSFLLISRLLKTKVTKPDWEDELKYLRYI